LLRRRENGKGERGGREEGEGRSGTTVRSGGEERVSDKEKEASSPSLGGRKKNNKVMKQGTQRYIDIYM
jgi:hypothetical protein